MVVINFIIQNILTQSAIIIALIALLGLVLQKKSFGTVLTGTFKTLLGFEVLSAGSTVITASLTYFGKIFQHAFHLNGVVPSIEAINGQAMNTLGLGNEIAFTFLGIFIVNIIIARFSPWKYIFLTGQALLWMSTMTVVGGKICGFNTVVTVVLGSIIGGIFAVAMPALAQPFVRKITGNDAIALGHFCTVGYLFEAGAAWIFGERGENKHSVEDIKLPKALEFMQDTYLSVAVVMVPLYLITAAFAGPKWAGVGTTNYMVESFLQAVQFVVGVYVLLAGVRLLLGEIVPAFRGIAMKLVPDAKPALDCPVLFPYSPNAVILGFVTTTIGTVIGMFLMPVMGLAVILPGMLTNFFAGGTAGIFGNVVGGRRGAIIGGVLHGLFITLLPALLVVALQSLGFVNASATDSDTIVAALMYAFIFAPILKAI
ncbi:PTS sugar transporter subunit IIC [Liquorilactobacillus mali]|uniref:Ascorbate-specific PTS system EIIC component n=1 Tax=Liquorilactobacillus mali KCTC 3596 = DSM 20444 TaxID=1046596 RepID=J1F0M5_9LACO|nr:PTS sugar transporter subunit IIC [Liquorilactobacillus mali]EJE97524.1 PTS system ascorbate-specific transporter subunit IIC [Liquorilactobacillus mali KCTC 3596 = DSM 20444]KRN11232.1 PTS system ascorbate-specific transporter subunit IIC [Liquorilactobacillus mali KCTC 3596 = DSM 20444]MDC7954133.1 PTS sugar transporter subunit IIC [Liquorilactobacillus mali]QFQ73777.1 PTS sugar transporter subunit IIC [Liquorilactobacillus mali]